MYLADARFTKHYEDVATGLTQYLHDAIGANADRLDG
jgi:MerR family transcriptional regulator, thiopeptide resistance regulator